MHNTLETAEKYAYQRIYQIGGGNTRLKVNGTRLKEEIVTASCFGELSALERMMAEIVSDPALTRGDIEAKLHLAIVDLYNFVRKELGANPALRVKLDQYLALRGYYDKSAPGAQVHEN